MSFTIDFILYSRSPGHTSFVKLKLHTFGSGYFPFPFPINSWHTPFYSLLLWVSLFQVIHTSGIIQYIFVVSCWFIPISEMSPGFIHVVANCRNSFPSFSGQNIPLSVYPIFVCNFKFFFYQCFIVFTSLSLPLLNIFLSTLFSLH